MKVSDEHREAAKKHLTEYFSLFSPSSLSQKTLEQHFAEALAQRDQVMIERLVKAIECSCCSPQDEAGCTYDTVKAIRALGKAEK